MTNFISFTVVKDNNQLAMDISIDDISRYTMNLNNPKYTDIYLKSCAIYFTVIGSMTDIAKKIKRNIPS